MPTPGTSVARTSVASWLDGQPRHFDAATVMHRHEIEEQLIDIGLRLGSCRYGGRPPEDDNGGTRGEEATEVHGEDSFRASRVLRHCQELGVYDGEE
jgi:hypothetical protein